jgi:hypothetical protein
MPNLHQIQIRYDAVQDRALLRVATSDANEFRFWITRRYARLLWQALAGSAARSTPAVAQAEPAARQAVVAFEKEAALARADFDTGFAEQRRETPLGDQPVLLARVKCARLDDQTTLLALHPLEGQGIEIRLDTTLLHSVLKLLADAAASGEWDLNLERSEPAAVPAGPMN